MRTLLQPSVGSLFVLTAALSALPACSASHGPPAGVAADSGTARDASLCSGPRCEGVDASALPLPPSLSARFVPDCGPADGPALRVYVAAATLECAALDAALPSHVELYLDGLPDAGGPTTYSWGSGPRGYASLQRCSADGTCAASVSGEAVVTAFEPGVRLVLTWRSTFADGSVETGEIEAAFCPRASFCG